MEEVEKIQQNQDLSTIQQNQNRVDLFLVFKIDSQNYFPTMRKTVTTMMTSKLIKQF